MTARPAPLSRRDALERILRKARPVETETVSLTEAAGRILREAVKTDRPMPPFHRATMDGYAVRSSDFTGGAQVLEVTGVLPAGMTWTGKVPPGACVKIMTGAPMPDGTDAVVKVEDSIVAGKGVRLDPEEIEPGFYVHPRGSDARTGRRVLPPGRTIGPIETASMASFGHSRALVSRPIEVRIVSTGREVVPPTAVPGIAEIRNANGPALTALFQPLKWVRSRFKGIAEDREGALRTRLKRALIGCDVLVTTGGVSLGDYDYVPSVLADLGVRQVFHRIAMRPGRPLWFGHTSSGTLVFGVPGNPVSCIVAAHEFILPALRRRAGLESPPPQVLYLPLTQDWSVRHPFEEARIARLLVSDQTTGTAPIPYGGSGDFVAALEADGLAFFPAGGKCLKKGATVEFHPWRFS